MPNKQLPTWFADAPERLAEIPFPVRFGEDTDKRVEEIASSLAWSKARVYRVLVRRALLEFDKA